MMKKNDSVRRHKILYVLSLLISFSLISIMGNTLFAFGSDFVTNAPNLSLSILDNSIIMTPTVPVSGTVVGNQQISSMTWNVDEGNVTPIPGFVPGTTVEWSFNISHLSNGLHTLQINATNSAGLVISKTISFTLYNDSPVPTASLPNGTYQGFQTVKLETSDPALIFYTLDGTTPTLSSSHGDDSITLPEIRSNTILKYFAVDAYGVKSNVNTQIYIINGTISSTPVVSNTSDTIMSTQKIQNMLPSDNKTTLDTTVNSILPVLPKSSNVISNTSILTTSQNMTTIHNSTSISLSSNSTVSSVPAITQNMTSVHNSTSISLSSNSTVSSVPAITQNMTSVHNSTSISLSSNSTVSSVPAITQNMTSVHNSTISTNNQINSTLNVAVNGTK